MYGVLRINQTGRSQYPINCRTIKVRSMYEVPCAPYCDEMCLCMCRLASLAHVLWIRRQLRSAIPQLLRKYSTEYSVRRNYSTAQATPTPISHYEVAFCALRRGTCRLQRRALGLASAPSRSCLRGAPLRGKASPRQGGGSSPHHKLPGQEKPNKAPPQVRRCPATKNFNRPETENFSGGRLAGWADDEW
jgi:hypothetical protein